MAWFSSGSTNTALISNLARNGLVTSDRVKNAMLAVRLLCSHSELLNAETCTQQVDRAHFTPSSPYEDSPQYIGHSATISAPHMHAAAAESMLPYLHPTARVLDIGSGSGYLTAVLANLVGDQGKVVGVDHIQGLVDMATKNMRKSEQGKGWLENGKVKFVKGDGRLGFVDPEVQGEEQWDAIHVGAAAKEAHDTLIRQLRRPGRLFIPVGVGDQWIWVIDKDATGNVTRRRDMGVRYVPLTDAPN